MKNRFFYTLLLIFSVAVSSVFATSSSSKKAVTQAPKAGVMNWKPAMLTLDPGHGPHTPLDGAMFRVAASTTPTYGKAIGASAGVYYLKKLGDHIGVYAGTEYMQLTFSVTTVSPALEYAYKHAQIPVILTYMPSQYIHVGLGAKYSYLLSASVNGRVIDLPNNKTFNRNGVGLIADLSFSWSGTSPRLGFQYIYNTGAALVGQNYSTIDVSIRVPFLAKK